MKNHYSEEIVKKITFLLASSTMFWYTCYEIFMNERYRFGGGKETVCALFVK